MSFNVSGMMKGIGAGLVNYGEILKEQDKQDWDEQQALLKYEREERMNKLKIAADKENTKYQVDAQATASANQTAATIAGNNQEFTLGQGKLKIDQQNANSNTTQANAQSIIQTAQAREANAKAALSETQLKFATEAEAKEKAKQEEKILAIESSNLPPAQKEIEKMNVILGKEIQLIKTADSSVRSEDVAKIWKDGIDSYTALKDSEKTKVDEMAAVEGLPGDVYLAKQNVKNFAETMKEISPKSSVLSPPNGATSADPAAGATGSYNPNTDNTIFVKALTSKDPKAIQEVYQKVVDSGDGEALVAFEKMAEQYGANLQAFPSTQERTKGAGAGSIPTGKGGSPVVIEKTPTYRPPSKGESQALIEKAMNQMKLSGSYENLDNKSQARVSKQAMDIWRSQQSKGK